MAPENSWCHEESNGIELREFIMSTKTVVIGGTGLIGSKLIERLTAHGHQAVPAAPNTGVNSVTGEGLAEVLRNASVVVDVSNSPSFEEKAVMDFFTKSTRNLLACGAKAGVKHYVALSVAGTDRLEESAYIRAKIAQEKLIRESGMPYSIVHATQFFEFVMAIAAEATVGNQVRVPPAYIQPIAAEDVANAVADVTVGAPLNGMVEVGGPERFSFEEFIGRGLRARNDSREVVVDPNARYFGARLSELTLTASDGARTGAIRFEDWLKPAASAAQSVSPQR
jgi:uncharacterized protein YbjT (DUF2867 family)